MSEERVDDKRTLYRGEGPVTYCFDFQDFPPITAGQTMSSATAQISSGPATPVLTVGTVTVTAAEFSQLDRDGRVVKSVPAGAGVTVVITPTAVGGAKGECVVTCVPTFSGGSKLARRCRFVVK